MITFVGVGAPTYANNTTPITPALHASTQQGDATIGVFYQEDEASTWGAAPEGWEHLTGSPWKGGLPRGEINLAIIARVQPETPVAPSLTQDQVGIGSICAYTITLRGNFSSIQDLVGVLFAQDIPSGTTIGPIPGIGPVASGAAIFAIGFHGDSSTSHNTLNDGVLPWTQAIHSSTELGADSSCWADYAIVTGTPTVANQTFTLVGGDGAKSYGGILFSIKETIVAPPSSSDEEELFSGLDKSIIESLVVGVTL